MEKKIEFLGSVNGIEFTCINEYNTAIKELLDSNEPFDAQTVSHFSGWQAEEAEEDVEEVESGEYLTDEQVAKVFEILLDTFKKLR